MTNKICPIMSTSLEVTHPEINKYSKSYVSVEFKIIKCLREECALWQNSCKQFDESKGYDVISQKEGCKLGRIE